MFSTAKMDTTWLDEAHRRFGDRKDIFKYVDTPYSLWYNLFDVFEKAYASSYNDLDIKNIYEYADWCCRQPRGTTADDDLLTVVAVCFYEHIPENPEAVKDMPRWLKFEEVTQMKEILSYHVGDEGYRKIVNSFTSGQH